MLCLVFCLWWVLRRKGWETVIFLLVLVILISLYLICVGILDRCFFLLVHALMKNCTDMARLFRYQTCIISQILDFVMKGAWARAGWRVWDLGNGTIILWMAISEKTSNLQKMLKFYCVRSKCFGKELPPLSLFICKPQKIAEREKTKVWV